MELIISTAVGSNSFDKWSITIFYIIYLLVIGTVSYLIIKLLRKILAKK